MPAGVKPINCVGKKGRSGPKKREIIVKEVMAMIEKKVTQEALVELANNKVFEMLGQCKTIRDVQALGLPITLKGMKEIKDVNIITPKPLLYAIQNSDSDDTNIQDEETDKGDTGRDIGIENNINTGLLDSLSTD